MTTTMATMAKSSDNDDDDDGDDGNAKRTVFFIGDVTEKTVAACVKEVITLSEANPAAPIYLYISTLGGDVYEAFSLYDVMKFVPNEVWTIGVGKVMSAGCLILAAGARGCRGMMPNATLMYHAGYEVHGGTVWHQENELAEFKRQEKLYDDLVALECGKTYEEVLNLYAKERVNHYLTPTQCLEFGFIDKILMGKK